MWWMNYINTNAQYTTPEVFGLLDSCRTTYNIKFHIFLGLRVQSAQSVDYATGWASKH
jgi:hypothetical protein